MLRRISQADKDCDGLVSLAEYRKWVLANPEVLAFFVQVKKAINKEIKRLCEGGVLETQSRPPGD